MDHDIRQTISRLIEIAEQMALENPHDPQILKLLKNTNALLDMVDNPAEDFIQYAQQLGAVITRNES